ncbi:MAG: hypothetical protein JWR10_4271 [Rubritepida sp.]|nr:hypothetical protein [Rubritepida sp.]
MRPGLLLLLALGACTAPPPSAYVPVASGSGQGLVAVGRTGTGEECRLARTGSGGDIWCGEWSSPSARIRSASAATPLAAAEEARTALAGRLECAAPRTTTVLGGQPAAVMDCRRRSGGWPAFAIAAQSGSSIWIAEGVLPAYAAAEQSIGVLGGQIAAEASPLPSAALDQMAQRLSREAFATGDISRFEGLMSVGRDANQAERFVAAETAYRAALALQERVLGPNAPDRFLPMVLLALQLSNQGRFPEAEALFNRAATLAPLAAEPLATAYLAHYRGLHEANRGRNDVALALLTQGGTAYSRWVPPEMRSGAPSSARPQISVDPLATRALVGLIETRRNSAAVLRAAGRPAEAEAASASAQQLALGAMNNAVGADVMVGRLARTGGAIYAGSGDTGGAERAFARAATRFAVGIPRSRPLAETLLLRAANVSAASAVQPCRDAVAILRLLREGTTAGRIAPCVDAFIAAGAPEDAFEAAQLTQGGVTTTQIAIAAARLSAGARDPAVADALRRRDEADRALATRYRERDAAAAEGGRTDLSALNTRIAEAETAASEADAAAQSAAPGYGQLVQSISSAADVMGALAPGEALVATTLPPDRRGWTFLLLDGTVTVGRAGADTAEIAALVARIRASVDSGTARRPFDAAAAWQLHQALFGNVAEPLGRAQAMVALPEGPLLSLPFGLLVTSAPAQPLGHEGVSFLIARIPVTHVPAASSLVSLRRAGNSAAGRPWVGFGDPRPIPASFAARTFPAAPDCGRGLSGLAQLPASAIELQAAQQIMGATPAERRIGQAFTVAAVRGTRLRDYRVVHFATHGVLPGELSCLTEPAIIASAAPNGPDATQALVTAGTILDLDLDADLVVLSACNSGGGAAAGESLSTLARAFFFSGARGLLVTHWYVNDAAAARIAFFTLQNVRGGDTPAVALRKAQLDLMRVAGAGHPALWAPFALIGPGPAPSTRTARAG